MEKQLQSKTDEPEPPEPGSAHQRYQTSVRQSLAEAAADAVNESIRKSNASFPINAQTRNFMMTWFPSVTDDDWNNWKWQIKNSVRTLNDLSRFIRISEDERKALEGPDARPLAVTPYYLSLCSEDDPGHALRRTVVPVTAEYAMAHCEAIDPLGEDEHSPLPGLVHRYPDRVLFLVTSFCSTLCRYCTRSRMVIKKGAKAFLMSQWEQSIQYIEAHPEIRDVLLSGGDPLTMDNAKIEWLLARLRRIPHVEVIRIGTKVPAVLPQRITPKLISILKKYHPLYMSLHFTHPDEMTPETSEACTRLADAGIPLGSQTVLLSGINDSPAVMKSLMQKLMKNRVRPYYIYQCDPVQGTSHFRTAVKTGLDVIQSLRGHTSGYAVPQYVIDAPGGGGKIPLLPEYFQGYDGTDILLKNYEGKIFHYPDTGFKGTAGE